jgi:hypothetical protein
MRYSISPDTGFLLKSEPCVISVSLLNSELGLVRYLSTVPGDYFLSDHIAVVTDILTGSDASDFANLPETKKENRELIYRYLTIGKPRANVAVPRPRIRGKILTSYIRELWKLASRYIHYPSLD